MVIKILGTGCINCRKLESNAREAVGELGLQALIEKVTDMREIITYGVMRTPALVVDEEIKAMGRVLSVKEIKKYLAE